MEKKALLELKAFLEQPVSKVRLALRVTRAQQDPVVFLEVKV